MSDTDQTPEVAKSNFSTDSLYLLYVDAYHAGDSIFMNGVGRALAGWAKLGRRAIIVFNPLEGIQRFVEGRGGTAPSQLAELPIEYWSEASRLIAEATKRVVADLTELGLAAVGINGSDRSTVVVTESDDVVVQREWLFRLAFGGVVPVLSPLALDDGRIRPIGTGRMMDALAVEAGVPIILFPKGGAGGPVESQDMASNRGFRADLLYDFHEIGQIGGNGRFVLSTPNGLNSAVFGEKWVSFEEESM